MADMPEPMPQIEQLSGRMYGAAFDLSKAAMNVAASNIAMKSRIAELEAENARLSAMSATPRTPIFTCHKEDCAIKDCSIPLVGEEAIAKDFALAEINRLNAENAALAGRLNAAMRNIESAKRALVSNCYIEVWPQQVKGES